MSKEPKPLSEYLDAAPAELGHIIMRCLRKEPERRFQHMSDLKVELEELKEEMRETSRVASGRRGSAMGAKPSSRARWLRAGVFAILTAAFLLAISPRLREWTWDRLKLRQPPGAKQVAVLPFHSTGGDPAHQALCTTNP